MKPVDNPGVQAVDTGRMTGGSACEQVRQKCGQERIAHDTTRFIPSRPQPAVHDIHRPESFAKPRPACRYGRSQQTWLVHKQQQQ